jgi:hypothetical protein
MLHFLHGFMRGTAAAKMCSSSLRTWPIGHQPSLTRDKLSLSMLSRSEREAARVLLV